MDGFKDRVFLLCLKVAPGRSEAEDLAQEAFIRVWRGLQSFRRDSSLSTWIYHIVWNVCASYLERKGRASDFTPYREEDGDDEEAHYTAPVDDEAYRTFENRQFIATLMKVLPPAQKLVLTLYYLEEQSYQEIMAVTGWPMGTVKATLHRAKERVRAAAFREGSLIREVA
jgi:RNA polymerase sigma-70 factor (ECF subfamily)